MEKALGLDLLRVTEMAALAAARTMGCGNKDFSDQKATSSLREELNKLPMRGTIVIGEGERDEAPMLYVGEHVGTWEEGAGIIEVDIAVDPLENTNATVNGLNNAIAAIAMAERGGLLHAPDVYMNKIVVGPTAAGCIDINASPTDNIHAIAKAYDRMPNEIVIAVLDRDRHKTLIAEVRSTGARIKLIPDGDLSAGIAAAMRGTGVHAVLGIGGAPEGVLTAAALRCLGGEMQAKLVALSAAQTIRLQELGVNDQDKIYNTEDLAPGNELIFAATGVTPGDLLQGVRFFKGGARTETLIISMQSRKVRFVDTIHLLSHDRVKVMFK